MMVVKKLNIISNPFILLLAFMLVTYPLFGQNSLPINHTDSTKTVLLQQQIRQYELVDWSNIQKNRNTMPIFCKWELDIQDATNMPVKFRLGSQEYVDRLENKGTVKIDY